MARIWSCGFELDSITAGMEFDALAGTPTLTTTTVHGGTYALSCSNSQYIKPKLTASTISTAYVRFYINVQTVPGLTMQPFFFIVGGATKMFINLTTSNTLTLNSVSGQVGSASSALGTNTWHCVEVFADASPASGSRVLTARLDGTTFATSSSLSSTNVVAFDSIWVGNTSGSAGAVLIFDDIAVNDNTGSFQNSWPGAGKIVHLMPNGAGDNTTWVPLAGSNYANVNEVPPDDNTSYNRAATAPHLDDYTITTPSGDLDASATVNVVSVGVRYKGGNATQSNNPTFKVRFKASSGGTVSEGTGIQPDSSTTWKTNANAAPILPTLTLYQNPDASTITSTTLGSSQIGIDLSTTGDGTDVDRVSNEWLMVDYTPGAGGFVAPAPKSILQAVNRASTY